MIKKGFFYKKKFIIPFAFGFLISFSFLYIQDKIYLIFKDYGVLDFDFSILKKKITFFSLELPYTHIDYITIYFDLEKPNKIKIKKIEVYGAKSYFYKRFNKENFQKLIDHIKKYIKDKFNLNSSKYSLIAPVEIIFEPKVYIYNSQLTFSDLKLLFQSFKIDNIKEIKGYGEFAVYLKKYKINSKGNITFNWKNRKISLEAFIFENDLKIASVKGNLKDNKLSLTAYSFQLDQNILKNLFGKKAKELFKKYQVKVLKLKNNSLNIFVDNIYSFPLKYQISFQSLLSLESKDIKVKKEKIKLTLSSKNNILRFFGDNLVVFNKKIYKHFGKVTTKDFKTFNYEINFIPKKDISKSISLNGTYFTYGHFAILKAFIENESLLSSIFPKIKNYNVKFKNLVINTQINLFPFEALKEVSLENLSYENYTFNNITLKGFLKNKVFQGYVLSQDPRLYVKKIVFDLKNYSLEFFGILNDSFKKVESFLKSIKIKLPFKFYGKVEGNLLGKYNIKKKNFVLTFKAKSENSTLNLNLNNFTFPLKFVNAYGNLTYNKKLNQTKFYITSFFQGKNFKLFNPKFPVTLIKPFGNFSYTYPDNKLSLNSSYLAIVSKLNTSFWGTLNLTYNNTLLAYIKDKNENLFLKINQKSKDFYITGKVKKFNYKKFLLKNLNFSGQIYPNLNLFGYVKRAYYLPEKNLLLSNLNFQYNSNYLKIKQVKIKYKSFFSRGNFTYSMLNNKLDGNIYGNISLSDISKYYKLRFLSNFNTKYNIKLSYDLNNNKLVANLFTKPFNFTLNTLYIKSLVAYYKDILNIKVNPISAYFNINTSKKPYILNSFKLNLNASISSQNNIFKKAYLKVKDENLNLKVNNLNYNLESLKTNFDLSFLLKNYLPYLKNLKKDIEKSIYVKLFDKDYKGVVNISLNKMEYEILKDSSKSFISLKDIRRFLKKYNLILKVESKNLVKLKSKEFEVVGKLFISLPDNRYAYIKNLSGSFNLLNHKFIILHGDIKIDLLKSKGNINLIASTKKGDFTIFCIVSGDLKNPNVLFISYPYLPQNEILTLLLGIKNISEDYVEYQTKYFSIKPKFSKESIFESYMISLYIPITPNLIFEYSRLLQGDMLSYDIKYRITRDLYILSSLKKEHDINVMELGIGIEKNIW